MNFTSWVMRYFDLYNRGQYRSDAMTHQWEDNLGANEIDVAGDIDENLLGGFKVLILGGIAGKTTAGSGDDEILG